MEITYNTHRKYTAEGQVITAAARDGEIFFYDHSRMVDGVFAHSHTPRDASELQAMVRVAYDSGNYEANTASRAFMENAISNYEDHPW